MGYQVVSLLFGVPMLKELVLWVISMDGMVADILCEAVAHQVLWELFIPGLMAGDNYKYEILTHDDNLLTKTDPYAQSMALRPDTTSHITIR